MISKNKLKELSKYKTAKFCDEDNVFVVEGSKMCMEALKSDFEITTICATEDWYIENRTLIRKKVSPENIYEVNDNDLERITTLKTPNKVWVLLNRPTTSPIANVQSKLTLVLDKIQDPGNMGTIIRICDWYGIRNIVCTPDTASCYNPKVVQASMGGIFRTNITYTDIETFIDQNNNMPIYGAVLDGENICTMPLDDKEAILIIGNESKGISQIIQQKITHKIMIPNIGGTCESLNASVATGIICHEFMKRII